MLLEYGFALTLRHFGFIHERCITYIQSVDLIFMPITICTLLTIDG